MDKKEMPTRVLIPRLLGSMKHLLPRIAVAVCFAVLGQVVTIAIPVTLVYLALTPCWQSCSAMDLRSPSHSSSSAWCLPLWRALLRSLCGLSYLGCLPPSDFCKIAGLGSWELDRQDSGSLLKMIGEDIEALEVFFAHTIAPICTGILVALGLTVYFGLSSWGLALILW